MRMYYVYYETPANKMFQLGNKLRYKILIAKYPIYVDKEDILNYYRNTTKKDIIDLPRIFSFFYHKSSAFASENDELIDTQSLTITEHYEGDYIILSNISSSITSWTVDEKVFFNHRLHHSLARGIVNDLPSRINNETIYATSDKNNDEATLPNLYFSKKFPSRGDDMLIDPKRNNYYKDNIEKYLMGICIMKMYGSIEIRRGKTLYLTRSLRYGTAHANRSNKYDSNQVIALNTTTYKFELITLTKQEIKNIENDEKGYFKYIHEDMNTILLLKEDYSKQWMNSINKNKKFFIQNMYTYLNRSIERIGD